MPKKAVWSDKTTIKFPLINDLSPTSWPRFYITSFILGSESSREGFSLAGWLWIVDPFWNIQRDQVACYVFAFTKETKPNVARTTELLFRLESVNARAASKCCGLCAASFVCVIVSFSLPLQTIPSIVVLSSRVRRGLVADVRVFERSISGKRSFDDNSFAEDRIINCKFKYGEKI